MTEQETEEARALAARAFALAFCNAPIREGEEREGALKAVVAKAGERRP